MAVDSFQEFKTILDRVENPLVILLCKENLLVAVFVGNRATYCCHSWNLGHVATLCGLQQQHQHIVCIPK